MHDTQTIVKLLPDRCSFGITKVNSRALAQIESSQFTIKLRSTNYVIWNVQNYLEVGTAINVKLNSQIIWISSNLPIIIRYSNS
jgi:hypothetical protein